MPSQIETSLFSADDGDESPVYHRTRKLFGRRIWYFKRYEDVKSILSNHEIFSNHRAKIGMGWLERVYEAYEKGQTTFIGQSLVDYDPPDHTRIRGVINKTLTPERMKVLQHYTEEVVDALLDDLSKQNGGDILNEYAYPIAIRVAVEMLGYPDADIGWLLRVSAAQKKPHNRLRKFFTSYMFSRRLREIYSEQAANPKAGLISMLHEAEKSRVMTREEALHSLNLLIFGGFEATANFIGNAILALLLNPEDMQKLKNGKAITERSLEELFRYTNIFRIPRMRWATSDGKVGGLEVKRGDMIVAMLDGANHDPGIFENADELDLERSNNPHVAFGHGIHYCLGAPLARMVGKIALEAVIARFPKLRLAVGLDELTKIHGWNVTGIEKLPVRWD